MYLNLVKMLIFSLKDYVLYISIISIIWYYSETVSSFIIKYKFSQFIIIEIIYWFFGLFCLLLDNFNVRYWKVAKKINKSISDFDMLLIVIRNHIILGFFTYLYLDYYPPKKTNVSKGIMVFLLRVFVYYLLYDIIFYTGHIIMHHRYFYKMIHKQHHLTHANIGISGYYMGVIDFFGEFIIPFFLPAYILGNDPLIILTYGIIGNINGILSHSGFNFPFMPYSKDHLIHHTEQKYNYGVFIMDYIFRTNKNSGHFKYQTG